MNRPGWLKGYTGSVSKKKDGSTLATLKPENYDLTGAIAGDLVFSNTPAFGNYDSPSVGTGKTITVNGLGLIGIDAANYSLASSTISGPIGAITGMPKRFNFDDVPRIIYFHQLKPQPKNDVRDLPLSHTDVKDGVVTVVPAHKLNLTVSPELQRLYGLPPEM